MIAVPTQDPTTKNIIKIVIEDVKGVEKGKLTATDKELKNGREVEVRTEI